MKCLIVNIYHDRLLFMFYIFNRLLVNKNEQDDKQDDLFFLYWIAMNSLCSKNKQRLWFSFVFQKEKQFCTLPSKNYFLYMNHKKMYNLKTKN